jgi:hypothetical protein
MAGRPRTKARRVWRLFKQHEQLAKELRHLGRYYMPKEDEPWDLEMPSGDADFIPYMWRKAVYEAENVTESIDGLYCFLDVKAMQAEAEAAAANHEAGVADDLGDQPGQPVAPGQPATASE